MNNYYKEDFFEKTKNNKLGLYLVETFQSNTFALDSNVYFNQNVPLDFVNIGSLKEVILSDSNLKLNFTNHYAGINVINALFSECDGNEKEKIMDWTKDFVLEAIKAEKINSNHQFLISFLNSKYSEDFTKELILLQTKYIKSCSQSLKEKGAMLPLVALVNNGLVDELLVNSIFRNVYNDFSNGKPLSSNFVSWFSLVKENSLIANENKSLLGCNLLEAIKDLEDHIESSPALYKKYKKNGLEERKALGGFLLNYSLGNIRDKRLKKIAVSVLADIFSKKKIKSGIKDTIYVLDFLKGHIEKSQISSFVEEYTDILLSKDVATSKDVFLSDTKKLMLVLGFRASSSSFSDLFTRDDYLENIKAYLYDFISKNTEFLSSDVAIESFFEVVFQTPELHSSKDFKYCVFEAIEGAVNGGRVPFLDILKDENDFNVNDKKFFNNSVKGLSGNNDKITQSIIKTLKKVYKNTSDLSNGEDGFIDTVKRYPGFSSILYSTFTENRNFLSIPTLSDSFLVEPLFVFSKSAVGEYDDFVKALETYDMGDLSDLKNRATAKWILNVAEDVLGYFSNYNEMVKDVSLNIFYDEASVVLENENFKDLFLVKKINPESFHRSQYFNLNLSKNENGNICKSTLSTLMKARTVNNTELVISFSNGESLLNAYSMAKNYDSSFESACVINYVLNINKKPIEDFNNILNHINSFEVYNKFSELVPFLRNLSIKSNIVNFDSEFNAAAKDGVKNGYDLLKSYDGVRQIEFLMKTLKTLSENKENKSFVASSLVALNPVVYNLNDNSKGVLSMISNGMFPVSYQKDLIKDVGEKMLFVSPDINLWDSLWLFKNSFRSLSEAISGLQNKVLDKDEDCSYSNEVFETLLNKSISSSEILSIIKTPMSDGLFQNNDTQSIKNDLSRIRELLFPVVNDDLYPAIKNFIINKVGSSGPALENRVKMILSDIEEISQNKEIVLQAFSSNNDDDTSLNGNTEAFKI